MTVVQPDPLSTVYSTLADPSRRAILAREKEFTRLRDELGVARSRHHDRYEGDGRKTRAVVESFRAA